MRTHYLRHVRGAIAEFEFTLTFATAPIDIARASIRTRSTAEKRGALVFGEGKCITCDATKGKSNEMFSDFENHVVGIPQLVVLRRFGARTSTYFYDGPGENEDFGAMQISSAIP